MKKITFVFSFIILLNICLSGQKYKPVTVLAGTRITDYFPSEVRYRYPDFVSGQIFFKNGSAGSNRFNYDLLRNEMLMIQSSDTMIIVKKKDIGFIAIAQDTFIYNNGYLEVVHNGMVKVWMKQYIKMKEVLKRNAMGQLSHVVNSESYSGANDGSYWDMTPVDDVVFQKTVEFYIMDTEGQLVDFRKKTLLQMFPQKTIEIEGYLKKNKVNFESKEDVIRLAGFIDSIIV
jgi:hypothetical protein